MKKQKISEEKVFTNFPLDCWCCVILFLYSNKDYRNLCLSIKSLCWYSKKQNPWCLVNIKYQISEVRDFTEEEKKKVTHIYYNKKGYSKIKGLENLKQLRKLYLIGNKISKIEGLENLKQLQKLDLNGNQISKIEGLENLKQLQKVWLDDNKISKMDDKLKGIQKNGCKIYF